MQHHGPASLLLPLLLALLLGAAPAAPSVPRPSKEERCVRQSPTAVRPPRRKAYCLEISRSESPGRQGPAKSRHRQEEEAKKKRAPVDIFEGLWKWHLEGGRGPQKRVAEQASDEMAQFEVKGVQVLGKGHSLWQGAEAGVSGSATAAVHTEQSGYVEHDLERLEHMREELKKATEILEEEIRREG
ncbi:Coiled-Coil Domain-Containing Glutamate-Rich Protein 2 [Manis pentadactyla]|nr:Coiled-Coil Domain-Containing Glutamate-Rich Protein 2 [Manis pentadactyla]